MTTLFTQSELEARLVKKLNSTTFLAYALIRDEELLIDQISPNFKWFLGYPDEEIRGKHLTDVFVEFIGSEDIIVQVMHGLEPVYRLEYVARERTDGAMRYYTIEVIPYEASGNALLLLLLDTSVAGRLQQRLTQERNELAHEVQRHEITQIKLQAAKDDLSDRVVERTAELARTNAKLLKQIEERKKVEADLLHVQKMEAIGELAGGVAHDFNNWLTVINTYAGLLKKRYPDDDTIERYAKHIGEAGRQAHALTSQLLTFSRKQVAQPTILNLNNSIENISDMVGRVLGRKINVTTQLSDHLESVFIDPGHLHQIVMNLVFNARDAMRENGGGNLQISTANVPVNDLMPILREENNFPMGAVVLQVSDTGHGMTEEVKNRIFDPFYTTKDMGKGTGLGLSTVYGIVAQSDGHIHVDSVINEGTTFSVYLPIVHVSNVIGVNDAPFRPNDLNASQDRRGNELVLVVDDEPMIRELVRECLESIGYKVLTAVDGEHAKQLVSEQNNPLNLLLTDVIMPGINGKQLVQQLGLDQANAKTQVLYMSGYSNEVITENDILVGQVNLLKKPFTADELLTAVYDVLHSVEKV